MRALDVSPPRHIAVELVLTGAGDGSGAGLSHHLAAIRRLPAPRPWCSGSPRAAKGTRAGGPRTGVCCRCASPRRLVELAGAAAPGELPGARAHRGRGLSPALPARRRGVPAITLGALDRQGLAPRSHLPEDRAAAIDAAAADRVLGLALALVDALDAELTAAASA